MLLAPILPTLIATVLRRSLADSDLHLKLGGLYYPRLAGEPSRPSRHEGFLSSSPAVPQ